jgi:OOP family OmpA-OmpF porin
MTKNAKTLGIAFACISAVLTQNSIAHETGMAHEGHVGDASGHLITDGFGDCVRTGTWNKSMDTEDCGGAPARPAVKPAPEPAAVTAPAAIPATPKVVTKMVSLKSGALFDVNSDALKPAGKDELAALASQLKGMSEIQNIKIVGHTDSSGSEDYNQTLSQRRAIAVKNYLLDQGIPASTMSTLGMGESSPVASNATREGRAQNRRVEITIQGTEAEAR